MSRKSKPPVALYSALADATRCRIVELLLGGPVPVHRLADGFSISRPAISRHLRVLKEAGLVAEVKQGRENLYALRADKLGKAIDWIQSTLAAKPQPQPKRKTAPVIIVAPKSPKALTPPPAAARGINQMGFDF